MQLLSSIRFRLITFIIFIVIVSTIIVTYVNITITKKMAISNAETTLRVSFSKIKTETEAWLIFLTRELESYGRRRIFTDINRKLTTREKRDLIINLKILLSANNEFSGFFVSSITGEIIASTLRLPIMKFAPISCDAIQASLDIKSVTIDGIKRKIVYTCLRNSSDMIVGYLAGIVNYSPLFERIYSTIQDLFKNTAWGITVCTSTGKLLYHYGAGEEKCPLGELLQGKGLIQGETTLKAFYYENLLDSFITLYLSKSDILGYYYRKITKLIYIILLFLIPTVLLSIYLLGHTLKPIEDLLWASERVRAGDLNITLPVRRSDEIGMLIRSFNEMVETLREDKFELERTNQKLQEAYRKLETINRTLAERNRELEMANQKLQILSITDSLTGLYNHRFLQETLEKELHLARRINAPISYLMIDIDNFKIFNDTYGHQAGDALLSQLGKLIVSQLRSSDIATRYGGEEFGIILPNTDKDGSIFLASKIRLTVAHHPFKIMEKNNEIEVHITVSIGASTKKPFVIGPHSREEIIREADEALYYAKRTGKNKVVHYHDIALQQ